ncbi:hypothetical protein EVAR_24491_1 [Eumeta japonica]|uniref:Uncharacterized protein n=1 Tax=Eumeta variegata TaxID=151549 RepID=A0A4C1WZ21_EUMVA|nr:hypothetical protein EVAR_24491_1 [Eumeta japonica]
MIDTYTPIYFLTNTCLRIRPISEQLVSIRASFVVVPYTYTKRTLGRATWLKTVNKRSRVERSKPHTIPSYHLAIPGQPIFARRLSSTPWECDELPRAYTVLGSRVEVLDQGRLRFSQRPKPSHDVNNRNDPLNPTRRRYGRGDDIVCRPGRAFIATYRRAIVLGNAPAPAGRRRGRTRGRPITPATSTYWRRHRKYLEGYLCFIKGGARLVVRPGLPCGLNKGGRC